MATWRAETLARDMIAIIPPNEMCYREVVANTSNEAKGERFLNWAWLRTPYKEFLSYGLIATRDPTFRVDDLIELHHSGGKERLAPL